MRLNVRPAIFALLLLASNSFGATNLRFPRIVSGNGWTTRISVRSLSAVSGGQGQVEVFDEKGVLQESKSMALPIDYVIQNTVTGWARVTVLANFASIDIDGSAV